MRANILLFFFLAVSALLLGLPVSAMATQCPEGSTPLLDNGGNTWCVKRPFRRIISLYTAHTENICSLGGISQLAGISSADTYPPEALNLPRFSHRDDPERFIAASPDLVLIRPMIERSAPDFVKSLRKAGIVVVSLQPNTVEELFDYWRSLGVLTGRGPEAEAMVEEFEKRLEEIRSRWLDLAEEQQPKVYFEAIHSKMKTFSPQSIAIFALEQAGGINIASDADQVGQTNIAEYGKERLLAKGEEIDVFLAQQGRMNPVTLEELHAEPGFKAIRAIKENKVHLVDEELVSRPSLRLVEGIDQVNRLLYPVQP